MKNNPFKSDIFTSVWLKHFHNSESGITISLIPDLLFIKHKLLNLFVNVGTTLTKGISYSINSLNPESLEKKVYLIYDVPEYFNIDLASLPPYIGLYKVRQYPGFLIDLEGISSLEDFLRNQFKKSSRYKLKKYRKRLESGFDIGYKTYYGQIEKEVYDQIFETFHHLLEKRFDDKQIRNNNLDPEEWDFYKEVAYPMILEKKASLFVIYEGEKPIAVTLNYLSEEVLFDAITVFDIDYSKFHVGSITIMAQIEWCLENGKKIMDFSKGYFDYKKRWCTLAYNFEYHIYFDRRSLGSKTIAWVLHMLLRLKQYLREKKVNEKLHRFTFWLKNRKKALNTSQLLYRLEEFPPETPLNDYELISLEDLSDAALKNAVFEFLYLKQEHINRLKLYKDHEVDGGFVIVGTSNRVRALPCK